MSDNIFLEYPNGEVGISFFFRGIIGLNNNIYRTMNKWLTDELKQEINSKLQELWKTDKDQLIQLVKGKKQKEIYDLFGIKEMENGWSFTQWCREEKIKNNNLRYNNNYLKFE